MVAQSNQLHTKSLIGKTTRPQAGFFDGKTRVVRSGAAERQNPRLQVICFCGSFKFYKDMEKSAAVLKNAGFKVVVPQPSHIRHAHMPASLKKGKFDKKTLTRWEGEGAFSHLQNIRKSDAVYIFNKGSYLGPAVTVEIGYALALGKPIFARAKVNDITITNFIKAVASPQKLLQLLR